MTTLQSTGAATAPLDHRGLEVLSFEECLRRVAAAPLGRVAFHDAGEVAVLPVNHVVDGDVIAFRTRWDSRLAAAVDQEVTIFEVDHYDTTDHTGWSVLVRGVARRVTDAPTCERFERLSELPWQGKQEEVFWTAIHHREVSGRALGSSREDCGCC